MKKLFTLLILTLTFSVFAQGDLTLSTDLTIQSGEDLTYNTLDLNGFDVVMKNNSSLTLVNLVGEGNISTQSNGNGNSQPTLIITGEVDCGTVSFLGNQAWNSSSDFEDCILGIPQLLDNLDLLPMGSNYKVFDIGGRLLDNGVIDENLIRILPRNNIFILSVEGFRPRKFLLN